MSFQEVEAVFFWRYRKSIFSACYGRLAGSTKYTKDFLQSPREQFPVISKILAKQDDEDIPLTHQWPGGSRQGEWRMSAADRRGQLSWLPLGMTPTPWKVGDPSKNAEISIPGNPDFRTERDADLEFERIKALDLDPWILAIKLRDNQRVLHSRAYLGNPQAGQESKGIAQLPESLQRAMLGLPGTAVAGSIVLSGNTALRNPKLARQILAALEHDPNVLLVGAPGTGKTVALEDVQNILESNSEKILFDADLWEGAWSVSAAYEHKIVSLVFHPSYTYEDFVAGLVPSLDGGGFRLTAKPGPIISLSHWASKSDSRRGLLIIDEFNRGPTAAIFGDTLALLDADKRSNFAVSRIGSEIGRPFPRELMFVEPEYADGDGNCEVGHKISLPKNVSIVAALNSSDRSVAPLDAALRRRFAIISVKPDYDALCDHFGLSVNDLDAPFPALGEAEAACTAAEVKRLAIVVLKTLNERLISVVGPDFVLGHALIWQLLGVSHDDVASELAHAFDERIVPALQLTFTDQDETLASVLNIGSHVAHEVQDDYAELARWILPPSKLRSFATARLEILPQAERSTIQILRALSKLL